jgi:pyochelin synthetase
VVEEPADDLERRIAALWAEMLGTDRIGRGQDFYSLGGDSLLLSRMVGRLREREPEAAGLEWQELLRHMLRDATVRGLATYLRSAADHNSSEDAVRSCIVHLNDAVGDGTADSTTWVLVHAGSGSLQPYQPVLPHLRAAHKGPLVGVQLDDVDRYLDLPPETVIDRLAADYTRELRGMGNRFRVIGYCVGGLLATEIARTLVETGATVDDLTIISSYRPPAVYDELMVEFVFALAMGTDLAEAGLPDDTDRCYAAIRSILDRTPDRIPDGALAGLDRPFREVGDRFRALAQRSQEDRLTAMHRASTAAGAYNSGSYSLEEFIGFYSVFRQSMHAVSRHRPGPYLGPVTLLRNTDSSTLLPGTRADVGEFWRRICVGELTVHDIPGDHFGCVAAAHAPGLAALLTGAM